LVPRSASAAISPGTLGAGVAITARSGTSGREATVGWQRSPSISA
jgi:hypothetical protein